MSRSKLTTELALLCLLLACRTASHSQRPDADSAGTTRAAFTANADSVATATPAAAHNFVLQPDSTCGLSSSADHANPAELVAEYLRRDGAGEFLRRSEWLAGALMCPGHVPGWDESTLISGHEVKALTVDDTSAAFEVRYARLGLLSQDSAGIYLIEPRHQDRHIPRAQISIWLADCRARDAPAHSSRCCSGAALASGFTATDHRVADPRQTMKSGRQHESLPARSA
jgi:hypothetical protein